jgi:DNA-binding transcriptional MerR regulator
MARYKDREEALRLRKLGNSYSQIKKLLNVGKGTLSAWLRDYPLTKDRIRELRDWNEQRIERYRETRRQKREAVLKLVYQQGRKELLPLSQRDLFIAGLFLYWGEGLKRTNAYVWMSNTDPAAIKFFIHWLTEIFGISRGKIRIYLHLYQDMNPKKYMTYWSETLNIPLSQFQKPHIKKSSQLRITYRGGFGYGTCNAFVGDAKLSKRILMALKVVSDKYMGA